MVLMTPKNTGKIILYGFLILMFVFSGAYGDSSIDYENHWAKYAIDDWVSNNIITLDDGRFRPNDLITRGEFVHFVNRAFGLKKISDSSYTDVSEEDKYYQDTLITKKLGYANGYQDGSFRPDQNITRQEAAVILCNVISLKDEYTGNLAYFKDSGEIKEWSKQSLANLISNGYMRGYEDETFKPSANMTRAEALVTIYNIKKDIKESVFSSDATLKKLDIVFQETRLAHFLSLKEITTEIYKTDTFLFNQWFLDKKVFYDSDFPHSDDDQSKTQYPEKVYVMIYKDEKLPEISAVEANDPKAQVEITQPSKETNQGEVKVTAESGEEKVYKIIIKRSDTTIDNALLALNRQINKWEKSAKERRRFMEAIEKLYQ